LHIWKFGTLTCMTSDMLLFVSVLVVIYFAVRLCLHIGMRFLSREHIAFCWYPLLDSGYVSKKSVDFRQSIAGTSRSSSPALAACLRRLHPDGRGNSCRGMLA
jgi:hypothetical protein